MTINKQRKARVMNKNEMWDSLIMEGVTEQTLQIVAAINGFNTETMEDVLYAHTGYRDFDQLEDLNII